jgi:DnaJ-class molecular chaperone
MTHYATLGVGENADADEIKRAYRKLASQHHPDKGGDTAKFQAIQTAYDTLSDAGKRQQYDMERQGMGNGMHFQFNGSMPGGIHDIFRNFGFNHSPLLILLRKRRSNFL